MQSWQLPEYIADILPSSARQLETAKEQLLALFRVHGYELVQPPLVEYSDALLTQVDEGLSLKTIRVVDQISGRQLGLRADITPQVARIDAHLLSANNGINRLCYAGTVLHARPDGALSTREPFQIGAELYGYDGVEADIELIGLMLASLTRVNVQRPLLALGHIGVFYALSHAAGLDTAQARELLGLLQDKDSAALRRWLAAQSLDAEYARAFALLPDLYGGREIIAAMQALPALPKIDKARETLTAVCAAFPQADIHIDLADLRVDSYHTGLLFAAYHGDWPDAVARGGRYNGLGRHFGRARPATGFSFDLRDVVSHLPAAASRRGIQVSLADAAAARAEIERLRALGECVVVDFHNGSEALPHCDRRLVKQDSGTWLLKPL
ncbi:ATP phosphoribosyltransferase regulatory subunit [Neisseria sp. HSC-16F19]|nr:ATP phosphoribosyltransferase regulatory subunit [Neisseria sp. HSC-16F19]MCP2041529.1 ATP phosphoribosyltransferase regulatory subunit [Neisseria sp. HSC-16F19]